MGSKVTDSALLAELIGRKADATTKELNRLVSLDRTRETARGVYEDMSPLERFGVARPVVETVQGIKSLFTGQRRGADQPRAIAGGHRRELARLAEWSGS